MQETIYKSTLHEMTQTTPTVLWNDSCSTEELTYSIGHGAVGATCNPVIVNTIINLSGDIQKILCRIGKEGDLTGCRGLLIHQVCSICTFAKEFIVVGYCG